MPDVPPTVSTLLVRSEDKKHSVIYKPTPTSGAEPPLTSLYLMRSAFDEMPAAIIVVISPAPSGAK